MLIRFKYDDITNILIRVKGNLELQTSAYFTPLPTSRLVTCIIWQETGDNHFKGNMRYVQPQGRIAGRNRAVYLKFKALQGLVIVWENCYKHEDQVKLLPKCMSRSGGCLVVLVEKGYPLPAHKISKSLYLL